MIKNGRDTQGIMMPEKNSGPSSLPAGAEIQRIDFTTQPAASQKVLVAFPPAIGRWAVLLSTDPAEGLPVAANELLVLTVAANVTSLSEHEEAELMTQLKDWVDSGQSDLEPASLMMTLQGARIFWSPGRIALLAPEERLETVCAALVEASFYEGELRTIEQTLTDGWPQLETDLPLAFEFQEKSIGKRKKLQQQFQQSLLLRAQLARISPHVHCPHLHPPTLASQVGERVRERTRMVHRHESLSDQLEVFERVYELCGERASNFMLTRSGNILEWIIILLLLTQILFGCFEILTNLGDTSTTTPVTSEVQVTSEGQ